MPREPANTTYVTAIKEKWPSDIILKDSIAAVLVSITRDTEYSEFQSCAVVNLLLRQEVSQVLFILGGVLQLPNEPFRRRLLPSASRDAYSSEFMKLVVARVKNHIEGMWKLAKDFHDQTGVLSLDREKLQLTYHLLSDGDELLAGLRRKEKEFEAKVYRTLKAAGYDEQLWTKEPPKGIRCSAWEEYQGDLFGDEKAQRRFIRFLEKLYNVKEAYDHDKVYAHGANIVVNEFAFREYKKLLAREVQDLGKQLKVDESLQEKYDILSRKLIELNSLKQAPDDLQGFEVTAALPFSWVELCYFNKFYVLTELAYQLVLVDRGEMCQIKGKPWITTLIYPSRMPPSFEQNHRVFIVKKEQACDASFMHWLGVGFRENKLAGNTVFEGHYGHGLPLNEKTKDEKVRAQVELLLRQNGSGVMKRHEKEKSKESPSVHGRGGSLIVKTDELPPGIDPVSFGFAAGMYYALAQRAATLPSKESDGEIGQQRSRRDSDSSNPRSDGSPIPQEESGHKRAGSDPGVLFSHSAKYEEHKETGRRISSSAPAEMPFIIPGMRR